MFLVTVQDMVLIQVGVNMGKKIMIEVLLQWQSLSFGVVIKIEWILYNPPCLQI